jgi:hypothetical protein
MVDHFATRLNYQVPRFHSWLPDPEAEAIDTFLTNWNEFFYAFPPFCLIGRVVQKIVHEGATGIVVVPDWPTKSWYALLEHVALAPALLIPVTNETLFLPCRRNHAPHPLAGRLNLKAFLVNGGNWN